MFWMISSFSSSSSSSVSSPSSSLGELSTSGAEQKPTADGGASATCTSGCGCGCAASMFSGLSARSWPQSKWTTQRPAASSHRPSVPPKPFISGALRNPRNRTAAPVRSSAAGSLEGVWAAATGASATTSAGVATAVDLEAGRGPNCGPSTDGGDDGTSGEASERLLLRAVCAREECRNCGGGCCCSGCGVVGCDACCVRCALLPSGTSRSSACASWPPGWMESPSSSAL
mmetsp:Transcript_108147/g.312510  ORF Transcript_108147/g.312510 Transcript_108147/m.312510 type:complete len:230 (+) Transcript_108147:609-1298(+)